LLSHIDLPTSTKVAIISAEEQSASEIAKGDKYADKVQIR
jgi:hypothetical protein